MAFLGGITKKVDWTGKQNGKWNRKQNWKMEQIMENLYESHINLMIFAFFP